MFKVKFTLPTVTYLEHLVQLAISLKQNAPTLKYLNIGGNLLTEESVTSFAEIWQDHSVLAVLKM